MNLKELIVQYIKRLGYRPEVDEDGHIQFKYQMKTLFINVDEDNPYVQVLLPNFYAIREGQEIHVMTLCNTLTRELRIAKVFMNTTHDAVSLSFEFDYTSQKALKASIQQALGIISVISTHFQRQLDDLLSA